jgi:hypothetical protein
LSSHRTSSTPFVGTAKAENPSERGVSAIGFLVQGVRKRRENRRRYEPVAAILQLALAIATPGADAGWDESPVLGRFGIPLSRSFGPLLWISLNRLQYQSKSTSLTAMARRHAADMLSGDSS